MAANTKVFCSKMVRGRRSDAQKSQVKALATTRKIQSTLPQATTAQMTLLPNTRAQAGNKKLEELIQQNEALVDMVSCIIYQRNGGEFVTDI